jgi:hypothetical protein
MSGGSPMIDRIAEALMTGAFDPQHAGDLFLRSDAEKAIRGALGQQARITVAGKDDGAVRSVSFLGARFTPDLIVESAPNQRIAVSITLLRGDASPVTSALATALVLAGRYGGVVAFILDRRLAKRNPFDDPTDEPAQRELNDAEKSLIAQLSERHAVRVVVRRQDPFGW